MIGIHYGQMIANPGSQEAFLITAEWGCRVNVGRRWSGGGGWRVAAEGGGTPSSVALSRALHAALMVELF